MPATAAASPSATPPSRNRKRYLILEAAFSRFPDDALVYLSARGVNAAETASPSEKVRMLVNLLQDRRFLVVLDGFERELRAYAGPSAAYQGDAVKEEPGGGHRACTDTHEKEFLTRLEALNVRSRVLITSRLFPLELENLPGCREEKLEGMDPEDAVEFFHAAAARV